jgi:hypothetical protein
MARAFDGVGQFLSVDIDLSAHAVTAVSLWLYWERNFADQDVAFSFGWSGNGFIFIPNTTNGPGGNSLVGMDGASGSKFWLDTFPEPTAATWHHLFCVFDRATPVNRVWLDSVEQTLTANLHSGDWPGGNFSNSTLYLMTYDSASLFGAGRMGEVGLYSGALGEAHALSLHGGGVGSSPDMVRPDALLHYWKLLDADGDIDYWGQANLSAVGSPPYHQHPPMVYPSWYGQVVRRAAAAYSLSIESGTFALTGQAVALRATHKLAIASGSFDETGQVVGLKRGYPLSVGAGSYSETGTAVNFRRTYAATIASGSFDLSGQAVTLRRGYPLAVASGSYVLTGQAVTLTYAAPEITFDASSNSGYVNDSFDWLHTNAGDYLVVGVALLGEETVSAVTFNGDALTRLGTRTSAGSLLKIELWGLANPDIGTFDVAVSLADSIEWIGMASSYNGVHQTTPTEDFDSATGISDVDDGIASVNITSVTDHCLIVGFVATNDESISVGAGQTERENESTTGASAALSDEGTISPAGEMTLSWSGVGDGQTWVIAGVPLRPASAMYSLGIGGGSFTLAGTAAGLKAGRKLAIGAGSFSETGTAVGLKRGYPIAVASGSYSLDGTAVGLRRGYPIAVASGSYTLSGQSVGLKRGYPIGVGSGSYTLSGEAVGLKRGYPIGVGSGSYALSGQAVSFLRSYVVAVASESYTLGGQAVGLKHSSMIVVGAGTYALTGSEVSFVLGVAIRGPFRSLAWQYFVPGGSGQAFSAGAQGKGQGV